MQQIENSKAEQSRLHAASGLCSTQYIHMKFGWPVYRSVPSRSFHPAYRKKRKKEGEKEGEEGEEKEGEKNVLLFTFEHIEKRPSGKKRKKRE